mgnify:CR=1 FL=1
MGEITVGHLALFVTIGGIVVSMLSTLGMFLLQRLFGTGDNAAADQRSLEQRVTKLESERALHESEKELQRFRMMEHVAEAFATMKQVDELSKKLDDSLGRLERIVVPIFKRMYPDTAVPE